MRLIANPVSRALHSIVLICLGASCTSACFGEEKDVIQFEGNTTFTAQQLSDELSCNPEYLLASCTNQSAESIAPLVERLLALGYKASGFPKASIRAQVQSSEDASSTIVINIDEGKQIKLGKVHVNGVDESVAELIREQLTRPRPKGDVFPTFVLVDGKEKLLWKTCKGEDAKTEEPHWKAGNAANFHWTIPKISDNVALEIEALGFVDTSFEASTEIKESQGVVDLIVNIKRLGAKRTADSIVVNGLFGSQVKDLLEMIELRLGDECDNVKLQTILRKMWESGRFSKHTASWHPETKSCLVIDVEKVAGVPWLNMPLDEKAQAVLKLREWLSGLTVSEQDTSFLYQRGEKELQVIISKSGVFARAKNIVKDKLASSDGNTIVAIGDANGIVFDYEPLSHLFNFPLGKSGGALTLSVTLGCAPVQQFSIPGQKTKADTFKSHLGFGATTSRGSNQKALEWTLAMNPAEWLPFAYRPDLILEIDNNNLLVSIAGKDHSEPVMVIDKKSGRIVKMNWDSTTMEQGVGLFEAACKTVSRKPDAFEAQKPITSLLAFVCQKECWGLYQSLYDVALNDNLRTAANKILQSNSLAPFDQLVSSTVFAPDRENFTIPPVDGIPKDGGMGVLFSYLPMKLGTFFPAKSWPRKVATTQALLALEQQNNAHEVIDCLLKDPAVGPVCHTVLAFVLKQHRHYRTSEVAKHGLDILDAASVGNDLQVLNSYLPEEWVEPPMNAILSFSPEEIASINELIPYPQVAVFLSQVCQSQDASLASLWQAIGFAQGNFLQGTLKDLEAFKLPPIKQNDRFASEPKKPDEKDKSADKNASSEENIGDKYLLLR